VMARGPLRGGRRRMRHRQDCPANTGTFSVHQALRLATHKARIRYVADHERKILYLGPGTRTKAIMKVLGGGLALLLDNGQTRIYKWIKNQRNRRKVCEHVSAG